MKKQEKKKKDPIDKKIELYNDLPIYEHFLQELEEMEENSYKIDQLKREYRKRIRDIYQDLED